MELQAPLTPTEPITLFPIAFVLLTQVAMILAEFAIFLGFVLVSGSRTSPSIVGIEVCSWSYWLVFALFHPVALLCSYLVYRYLLSTHESPSYRTYWLPKEVLQLLVTGLVSGLCGNMLLVGSGLIFGPVLLAFKIHPQVSSATSLFLVLFGTLAGAVQYWLDGVLNLAYSAFLDIVAVFAGVLGTTVVAWAVQRYQRTSIIILLLAGVAFVSLVVTPVYDGVEMWSSIANGTFNGSFHSFCE